MTTQAMWFGALAAAQQVFHALEVAWIETTALHSKTWTNFTSDVREAWHLVQKWLSKRWIDVMNLLGDLTDEQAEAVKQMADQDFADTAVGIEQCRNGALTEIAKQFDEAPRVSPRDRDLEKTGVVVPTSPVEDSEKQPRRTDRRNDSL